MDKLVGFWMLLLLFGLVTIALLFIQPDLLAAVRGAIWAAAFAVLIGLAAGVAVCQPRGAVWLASLAGRLPVALLRRVAEKLIAAAGNYAGKQGLLARALSSAGIHGVNILALWMAMRSLAIPASLLFAMVFYPLLTVLLMLSVSISGIGVRDIFAAGCSLPSI